MGYNGTLQLYGYIRKFYFWQKLKQDCTKHMHQCKECQQVSLKEEHYVDSNLWIHRLSMFFIAMDLLGDWNQLAHIAVMACNIFPHTATGKSPFFLMYRWDAYLPMLHNLLQPKTCYMGYGECKIHLDAMREVYMLVVLNLKISCDRHPPPMGNPCNDKLKIGI